MDHTRASRGLGRAAASYLNEVGCSGWQEGQVAIWSQKEVEVEAEVMRVLRLARLWGCQGQCTSKSQGRGTQREQTETSSPPRGLWPSCTAGEIVAGSSTTHRMSSPSSSLWVARMRPRLVSDKPVPHPEGGFEADHPRCKVRDAVQWLPALPCLLTMVLAPSCRMQASKQSKHGLRGANGRLAVNEPRPGGSLHHTCRSPFYVLTQTNTPRGQEQRSSRLLLNESDGK